MPRRLPRLDRRFKTEIISSLSLVNRLEVAMAGVNRGNPDRIRLTDIELAYELAYLRIFIAWEILLEESLLRFMCGYTHSNGREPLIPGTQYQSSRLNAEKTLLSGKSYLLWHNPSHVIGRASRVFQNSRYEQILASTQQRLTYLAAVRHRIAHQQKDAIQKFDLASMRLAGKRYRGSRPGRFLREWRLGANPPSRWLGELAAELESLSRQICS